MVPGRSKTARALLAYISISLASTVIVILLTQDVLFEFPPLKRAELSLIDLRFHRRGPLVRPVDSSSVVIVQISQESFKSLPEKWPWPRSYYTRLVRNLRRAGARAIGIDLTFSTPDPRSREADNEFRETVRESTNVVLAREVKPQEKNYTRYEQGENYGNVFINSGTRFGLVNVLSDGDGVLRRYMPFSIDSTNRIPTFSFAVLNAYFRQVPMTTAVVTESRFEYLGRNIPKYDQTSFLINYYGPSGTFRKIDIADVLDDKDFKTTEELNHPGDDINTFDDTTLVPTFDGKSRSEERRVGKE